jgi:prepilin-type N-terminal cleavage/methylation domain-containing protein
MTRASRAARDRGFTLVEVGLVILILGIVFGLVVPRFQDRSHAELVSHIRRLAVTFRFLRHQAILDGRTYRLVYNLDEHRYWGALAEEGEGEPLSLASSGTLPREVTLPESVGFSDVVFPLTAGKLFEGVGWTEFYPDGYVDLTVIHMDNGEEAYTLRVEPMTGNVYVTAGYHDFAF